MAKKQKDKRMVAKGQRLAADHRGLLVLINEYQLYCSGCGAEAGVLGSPQAYPEGVDPVTALCGDCRGGTDGTQG